MGFSKHQYLDTIDSKIFENHGGICTFDRKFNKISGERYCKARKGCMEICIFDLDPEGLVGW